MRVYIVGGDHMIAEMFVSYGHDLIGNVTNADLVQFTGGADVYPGLYGHLPHPATSYNLVRDCNERHTFFHCLSTNKPMAGICRGGQFLNVMCGGTMEQHVNNHGRTHTATVLGGDKPGRVVPATSTHHQMMRPATIAKTLMVAHICTNAENMKNGRINRYNPRNFEHADMEACFYEKQRVLCFQPHPEYCYPQTELPDLYFEFIEHYLKVGA